MRFTALLPIVALSFCTAYSQADQQKVRAIQKKEQSTGSKKNIAKKIKDVRVVIKTSAGDINATIYASRTPVTAANFLNLARRDYYDGSIFHRVIEGFVSQAGMHNSGTPSPGYNIKNETYTEHPKLRDLRHDKAGILSMARQPRKHTNGSQFYITHAATPHLDGDYTVFGKVTKGIDIAKNLNRGAEIKDIVLLDSADALFQAQQANVSKWNATLDKRFYNLKKIKTAAETKKKSN